MTVSPPFRAPSEHRMTSAGLAIATALLAMPAQAQDMSAPQSGGLEEIVVTAQRREENLQNVPIAVTAITADALASGGIGGTTGLPQAVPSVQLTRSGPSGIFFVRGVGNTSGGTGEEGANAIYVDGVYLPDLGQTVFRFNNIERIEVLKGPQGTLFGRNASGGLINVITREPGRDVVVKGQVGIANYESYSGQLYAASPLTDTLSADIALTGTRQVDGWGRNLETGRKVGFGWHWGVRSKAVWRSNDRTKIMLSGEYGKSDDDFASIFHVAEGSVGTGGTQFPGDYNTNTSAYQRVRQRIYGFNLTAEFDLDWATLTSITGFRGNKTRSGLDPDGAQLPLARYAIHSETDSFQEEIRLSSNDTEPLSWQTGLFFLRNKAALVNQQQRGTAFGGVDAGSDLTASMRTQSYAAFAEATYAVTPSTHVTAGLRYTRDDRTLRGQQTPVGLVPGTPMFIGQSLAPRTDSLTYGKFTYRLAIRQDFSDDINVYASYNRGFKSGLWALQSPANPPVDPQFIDAYEIGLKTELFDRRLRLNLSAYHYDISDYQVRAAVTLGAQPTLLNAASVDVDGIEAEFEAAPVDGLRLFGSATLMRSKFADFPFAPFTYPRPAVCTPTGPAAGQTTGTATGGNLTCLSSAKGNDTPLAPRFAANIGASYTADLGNGRELQLSTLYSYNDGYYFEVDNRLRQEAFGIVNGSIEFRPSSSWGVELWVRNLADARYHVQKLGSALGDLAVPAAPRAYGLNVKFDY